MGMFSLCVKNHRRRSSRRYQIYRRYIQYIYRRYLYISLSICTHTTYVCINKCTVLCMYVSGFRSLSINYSIYYHHMHTGPIRPNPRSGDSRGNICCNIALHCLFHFERALILYSEFGEPEEIRDVYLRSGLPPKFIQAYMVKGAHV